MLQAVPGTACTGGSGSTFVTLWATVSPWSTRAGERHRRDFPDLVEGRDWVDLGFRRREPAVINSAFLPTSRPRSRPTGWAATCGKSP